MGVIPIINIKKDFTSWSDSKKPYKLVSTELNYGGCSLMVERVVVVRKTRVRFSPSALFEIDSKNSYLPKPSFVFELNLMEQKNDK